MPSIRMSRLPLLAALLPALLLVACGAGAPDPDRVEPGERVAGGDGAAGAATPPTAATPPAAGTEVEDPALPATDCSAAAVSGDLPAQPELPPAVAATRRAIFAAATTCDFAALDRLAPPELRYSFGEHVDAIAAWREDEERGEPVLRRMAEVLRAAPDESHGLWTWPGFFLRPVDEWTPEDRREAERVLGDDLDFLTGSGAYLGYRVGIAADGTWQYFVAGD
jgi:hypothetical protein